MACGGELPMTLKDRGIGGAAEAVLSIRLRNQLGREVHNSRCHFNTRPIIVLYMI